MSAALPHMKGCITCAAAQKAVGGNPVRCAAVKPLPCVRFGEGGEALPCSDRVCPWEKASSLWERGLAEEVNTAWAGLTVTPLK